MGLLRLFPSITTATVGYTLLGLKNMDQGVALWVGPDSRLSAKAVFNRTFGP